MKTILLLAPTLLVLTVLVGTNSPRPTPGAVDPQSASQPLQLLPDAQPATADAAEQEEAQIQIGSPPKRPFTSFEALQGEFLSRFQLSPGFGYSRISRPVFLAPAPALVWKGSTYRVVPPDLIGLEDEPIVYALSEHSHRVLAAKSNLTSREVRKLFTHRPLTALETTAIRPLRAGRDLVVLTNRVERPEAEFPPLVNGPDLFVVGALRAGRDCAACHQCREGTLLGAFAYSLSPEIPSAVPGPVSRRDGKLKRLFAAAE